MTQLTLNFQNDSEATGGMMTSSSRVASLDHANRIQQPVSDLEKKMTDISGRRCSEQFKRFDQNGLWARTFLDLLIGMEGWSSTKCKLTWRLKGTKYNRLYLQQQVSALPTAVTEFGLWPTPRAQEPGRTSEGYGACLTDVINGRKMNYLLPTPRANKVNGCDLNSENLANRNKSNLEETVAKWVVSGMLPTPTASDNGDKVTGLENQNSMVKIAREMTGQTSQLNPQFVLEMMGFPTNWTELPFLNGETKA